jgi:tRNA pseudouridine55 synthase
MRGAEALTGVLVADKPAGLTSHDVVALVKRRLGAAKVGHLGTLDPLATGVLPLVMNGATKFASALSAGVKEYLCTLKLGEETDTFDGEGKVLSSAAFSHVTVEMIEAAFSGLRGRIMQTPPMYSSVKRNGQPLYRLARRGIVVEREPKEVEVFELAVLDARRPYVDFRVVCSRGTYVRSICFDAGRTLGCGAHLTALKRTRSGAFTIDGSLGMDAPADIMARAVIPLNEALAMARA